MPSEKSAKNPIIYMTWRDYFRNVTTGKTDDNWHFSQEDVKPGLMWDAQVLQRIAQQSRNAEHRLLVAEKLAAMALVDAGRPARTAAFDEAWQDVLLTQHHDCWIVPYNGPLGNTWIDQVRRWTTVANSISDLATPSSRTLEDRPRESVGRSFRTKAPQPASTGAPSLCQVAPRLELEIIPSFASQ